MAVAGFGVAYLGEGSVHASPDAHCARVTYLSGHTYAGHADTRATAILAAVRSARDHAEPSGLMMVRFC
ncbi:hypothetical protein GCM10023147_30210 [Tsukamurella soli]|uniref:Uncharacterized protein n=1 Tax=Tsukamurella soli TaxID=644556 RepID=A0ABP8JU48_9ACTN